MPYLIGLALSVVVFFGFFGFLYCWMINREADLIREGAGPENYRPASRLWAKIRPWRKNGRWVD